MVTLALTKSSGHGATICEGVALRIRHNRYATGYTQQIQAPDNGEPCGPRPRRDPNKESQT